MLKNAIDYPYDNTVDESQRRSLEKALAIIEEQRKEHKRAISEKIKRPDISIRKGLLAFAAALAVLFFLFPCVLRVYIESLETRIFTVLAVSAVFFLVNARKITVWLILVYQKSAPEELRRACVFEPSCSEYMLNAIDKYGVWRGVVKGIKRLLRCRYPNSGIDHP